jgi:rhodanese-related sulfurtransferase
VRFIQENLLLIAVAFASGAMLLWPLVRTLGGGARVNVARATQLINREDAIVVDVREPGLYAAGHIIGAKNVPLSRLDGAPELAKRKQKPLIVYDDGGDIAIKAAAALRKQGFANVVNLAGGLPAWQQAGLPLEK